MGARGPEKPGGVSYFRRGALVILVFGVGYPLA